MLKTDLIERITAQNPHLYRRDIEKIVNAILDAITEALHRGERVELRGFGAFSVKVRKAREGRNPRTRALSFQSYRRPFPISKLGKKCVSDLIREVTN